jgi:hypothetical protein
MRDVYRNAALVVAASDAKDASEGLFITNLPHATILRVLYIVDGAIRGTFNMTEAPEQMDANPFYGPLEEQA